MSIILFKITGIFTTYLGISDTYENAIARFCSMRNFELLGIERNALGKVIGFRFVKRASRFKIIWRFIIKRYNPDF